MRWRFIVHRPGGFFALALVLVLLVAGAAQLARGGARVALDARLDRLASAAALAPAACLPLQIIPAGARPPAADTGGLLASWRSVAGCGASSATGGGTGVKWIGRSVTGGLFGVQCQGSYSPLMSDRKKMEHHFVVNTLIQRQLTDRWIVGMNLPFVYKYLRDPYQLDIDLSNGGLGDASAQVTRRMGPIGATAVTATVGLPTGKADTTYRNSQLPQHQQLGFGRYTGSLTVDHTLDETWGLIMLGGVGSWRGGQNEWESYRAPSATAYSYVGLYLGPFVPTIGLSTTVFKGHDRDRSQEENSALFLVAGNVGVEWSTDWIAILAGASIPYQFDAVYKNSEGFARNPWRWGQWVLGLGVTISPF
jgi:hypothetical protein